MLRNYKETMMKQHFCLRHMSHVMLMSRRYGRYGYAGSPDAIPALQGGVVSPTESAIPGSSTMKGIHESKPVGKAKVVGFLLQKCVEFQP